MGNVMGYQYYPEEDDAGAEATGNGLKGAPAADDVGVAGDTGYGLGGTAAGVEGNKLCLSSETTNTSPLMPRGNPTGGGEALGSNFIQADGPVGGQKEHGGGEPQSGAAAPIGKQQGSSMGKPASRIPVYTATRTTNPVGSSDVNVAPRRPLTAKVMVAAAGSKKTHKT